VDSCANRLEKTIEPRKFVDHARLAARNNESGNVLQLLGRFDRYSGFSELLEHLQVLSKITLKSKNPNGKLIGGRVTSHARRGGAVQQGQKR